jgi:hypothetical protein
MLPVSSHFRLTGEAERVDCISSGPQGLTQDSGYGGEKTLRPSCVCCKSKRNAPYSAVCYLVAKFPWVLQIVPLGEGTVVDSECAVPKQLQWGDVLYSLLGFVGMDDQSAIWPGHCRRHDLQQLERSGCDRGI